MLILLLLILGLQVDAQTKPLKPQTRWTVEDVIGQESAHAFRISPDGKWVVWVKSRPDMKKNRQVSDLHLTSLENGAELRLTRGGMEGGSPRWSPDGRLIAFRSSRPGDAGESEDEADDEDGEDSEDGRPDQVWLINPQGGEPWKVSDLDEGIEDFAWLDAGTLVVSARESESLREKTLGRKKDDTVVVEDEEHFLATRLFTVDVESKETQRRTLNDDQISEFGPSPDGRWIVTRHHVSPHYEADARDKPKFFLHDLSGEGIASRKEIFTDPLFIPYGFIWAADSTGFYCLRTLTSNPVWNGPGVETLYWFDRATGSHGEVPLDWPNGIGGVVGYDVTSDGFLALLADGPVNRLARYTRGEGAFRREFIDDPKAARADSFQVGPDGATVVFTHSTASTPRQTFAGRLAAAGIAAQRSIAPVNESLRSKRMARSEVMRWKGALDDEVTGILFYPLDYQEGHRYPLVLMIHGGPNDVDLDTFDESWAYAAHLMAGKGAFILKPNYHGSTNHGQAFAESIKEHYYEYEIPDILKGIDTLSKKGMVDPDRLGVIGWSNGAILTWELITRTNRFKAAAPGAGDVNWTGDYGNCEFGVWFSNYYMGGPPWEKARVYIEKSPYFRLGSVKTPTIIFFGTEDRAVDTGQGWEAYRALQQIGRAPVRFLLFPGEPHTFEKPSHQRRKLEEEVAWFDRYLFGRSEPSHEALKENSPLDLALKAGRAARDGSRLGQVRAGVLVPEVIPWPDAPGGPVEVGRFEVTRAQFAAFAPDHPVSEATVNLPASGITLDQARAYCGWLSERTAMHFRLPTIAEMVKMIDKTDDDPLQEVTLDYWAGFPLNPDDARRLSVNLGALPPGVTLIRQVGSARPVELSAGTYVYDLGGNVSEWASDGLSGKAMGCNAYQPCDPLGSVLTPPVEHTGIRLVRME